MPNFILDLHTNPGNWITTLKELKSDMKEVKIQGKTDMSEICSIICILASLPKKYEVADSLVEERLTNMSSGEI